jgi:small GTP-binding protein
MALAKIAELEAEYARTQKNKNTEFHLGMLKAKIARLKTEVVLGAKGPAGRAGDGFDVTRHGDTRVGLIGFPSVGKSTLLNVLTGGKSESAVASYEFTTLTCIPGTVHYRGARIQLLDLPGIIEGAKDGKGRGRQVIGTARTCNMILIVLDASKPMTHKRVIERELEGFGIRLNKTRPNIYLVRKAKGGVAYRSMFPQAKLDEATVRAICSEYRLHNADITIRQPNCTVDDFIDVIEGNRIYMPALYVMNKIDAISIEELDLLDRVPNYVMVSAKDGWGLDDLLERIWSGVGMLRIYTKPRGRAVDYEAPVILQSSDTKRTIEAFCNRIHRGLLKSLKYAWVWGASVRHQPQRVGKDHVLEDEDVVQIVKAGSG